MKDAKRAMDLVPGRRYTVTDSEYEHVWFTGTLREVRVEDDGIVKGVFDEVEDAWCWLSGQEAIYEAAQKEPSAP